MFQNIYQNSTRQLASKLYTGHYYDFMLHRGGAIAPQNPDSLAIVEFCCPFSFKEGYKLVSTKTWKDSVNDGAELKDIGFTGIDNGFITFDKTRITNEEFLNIFTNSKYIVPSSDFSLFLTPISGNTGRFEFPMTYTENENECYMSFKGGFYQGFYKLEGFDYDVLPNDILDNRILHFDLRPRTNYQIKENTINNLHPENNGIFFYMGLRAENKMMVYYNENNGSLDSFVKDPNHKDIPNPKNKPYLSDELDQREYFSDEYNSPMNCFLNEDKTDDSEKPSGCKCNGNKSYTNSPGEFYNDGITWINDCGCSCKPDEPKDDCEGYFKDDYIKEEDKPKDEIFDVKFPSQETPAGNTLDEYSYNTGYCENPMPIIKDCHCSDNESAKINSFTPGDFYGDNMPEISDCKGCNCKNGECGCTEIDCSKYFGDDYMYNSDCGKGNKSIDEDYMKPDIILDENKLKDTLTDSEGHLISKKGYYEIETDNKFLMFDRTPEGVTVDTYQEGMKVLLEGRNDWGNVNLFELMNRTSTGYTVDNIESYYESHTKPYDLYKDIRNNAFALRITDKGAVGYRYGILDCDADNHYSVIEEYTKDGMVKSDEWNSINVRFVILPPRRDKCDKRKRKMKIMIYVNGFLKLVSKELPTFDFHALDECKEKQEGVPYSISLGGGTLGLLEMIAPDYYKVSNYCFPLEQDFCGSFIGDIKCFRIYEGFSDYSSILNYLS